MEAKITGKDLLDSARAAIKIALDYMKDNRCKSAWTGEEDVGWYEQWKPGVFSGLYATCSALMLYSSYKDEYKNLIETEVKELDYMYSENDNYIEDEQDNEDSRNRKEICRNRLAGNKIITLKAVYFLMACQKLEEADSSLLTDNLKTIMGKRWEQVLNAYDKESGTFVPSNGNHEDRSLLTTAIAYILLVQKGDAENEKIKKTRDVFVNYISNYIQFSEREQKAALTLSITDESDKFERYDKKRGFVLALYALAYTSENFTDESGIIDLIVKSTFLSMNDTEIRNGFEIRDSYRISLTTGFKWETLYSYSRLLYLDAIINLIKADILPISVLELITDDIEEIIDTIKIKKLYLSWDDNPIFSHHIRALNVLQSFIELAERINSKNTLLKISPYILRAKTRSIDRYSAVMFMPFGHRSEISRYDDIFESVKQVTDKIGFNLWRSTNELYDTSIMESIMERLSRSQFVIIDCSEGKANVMYEAGLSLGLGKKVFMCSSEEKYFPYKYDSFDKESYCTYNINARYYSYRDLQRSLIKFINEHLESFCLTDKEQNIIRVLLNEFKDTINVELR